MLHRISVDSLFAVSLTIVAGVAAFFAFNTQRVLLAADCSNQVAPLARCMACGGGPDQTCAGILPNGCNQFIQNEVESDHFYCNNGPASSRTLCSIVKDPDGLDLRVFCCRRSKCNWDININSCVPGAILIEQYRITFDEIPCPNPVPVPL
jgi:hypothetical protein